MRKIFTRFFTIADYEDEERWLRQQHQNGWRVLGLTPPCFYTFESCEPQDVIYRLDFENSESTGEYRQMAADFGWEYCGQFMGWLYFRRAAADVGAEGEDELFSDNESRVEMVSRIVRTRLMPLVVIFFCCLIPSLMNAVSGRLSVFSGVFSVVFGVMFVVYVFLIIHCGRKLRQIRDRYQN